MKLLRAVVEDNMDPIKAGRVRVRIVGKHTKSNEHTGVLFNFIDVKDLPWAEVMGGTDFGLVSGVGLSTVLRNGTWVWVIMDHDDPNIPIVVGVIRGVVKKRTKYTQGEGFNDPAEVYPYDARVDEPDINRLTSARKLADRNYDAAVGKYASTGTGHAQINAHLDSVTATDGVSGANTSQAEPRSTSDSTTYPNASVLETPSGHVVELDDTAGNERVRVQHRSGSYIEIKPDGTFVQKSVNTDAASHYIHMSDVQEHIAKGVKTYIENNLDKIILGGIRQHVNMDLFNHVSGLFKITANGGLEIVNDVKINGSIQITGGCSAGGNVTAGAEVKDSMGNLSSLRTAYNTHTHTGNLGAPVGAPTPDPMIGAVPFNWVGSPKGFK